MLQINGIGFCFLMSFTYLAKNYTLVVDISIDHILIFDFVNIFLHPR